MLQESQSGSSSRIPIIGNIPVLNAIFGSRSISRDEKELIILISPELVHPMEPEDAPSILPGMEVTEPDDLEFFVRGHIEGRPNCFHRSTVWWLYRDKLKRAQREVEHGRHRSSEYYVHGPHGFSN